ncbi:MAG: TIGR04282 family arsenosugar biosynthesis glycosyltransferase [Planctomycetaceae bacterium]
MNTLGIFAKHPERGTVKTRLAAAIGNSSAAELYAAFVRDLTKRCGTLTDVLCVAVTPESEAARNWFTPLLSTNAALEFQPGGDLGERIGWFFESRAGRGSGRSVLIGSDSPDLPDELIRQAFAELDTHDVVLGPATDGGFVLVGMKQPPGTLFDGIRWSQPTTLFDLLRAAARQHLSTVLLQPWYDIDTIENLGTLRALQHGEVAGNLQPAKCPRTAEVLSGLSMF